MTPQIVVALGTGVWVGYFVGYRNMILARREARSWEREATLAWAYADIVEAENVKLLKQSADQWDDGWLYAAKIDARGEVDP
jgi:hypothetical protein